jgi:thiol-disulfide isomerase/thioredoxin
MSKFIFVLTTALIISASALKGQNVPVMNFNQMEPLLRVKNDTAYMINFWATWCTPCVEEMPDILKFSEEMKNRKFRLILVSMDNPDHLESRVKPFIRRFEIKDRVILLDDPDANSWIEKVHPDWMGSIPATLFFSGDFRTLHVDKIDYEGLKKIVEPRLKR